jgi:hypothetical protein
VPATGLTLTRDELRAQMATEIFGIDFDDGQKITPLESRKLDRWLINGLRRFYYPDPDARGIVHQWRFLKTEFTFHVDVNTIDYLQPATFGGLIGDLVHVPTDNVRLSVVKVTPDRILHMRQQNLTLTNYPFFYAERSVLSGGISPTAWEIMVWPAPSGSYTFKGTQHINPLAPNAEQPWLYGGPEHSQTILAACLAEAESKGDGVVGIREQEFQTRLAASIGADDGMHQADNLGMNLDSSVLGGSSAITRGGRYFENFDPVTYGGSVYDG